MQVQISDLSVDITIAGALTKKSGARRAQKSKR